MIGSDKMNEFFGPHLAPPYGPALDLIARYSPIVEIGAAEGHWADALRERGVTVRAFDRKPAAEGVELGDHEDAAQADGALLAIWPPDGAEVQEWIATKPWPAVIIIGKWARFDVGDALASYTETGQMVIPGGRKGGSHLRCFERRS